MEKILKYQFIIQCKDPYEIYNEILKSGLRWPNHFKDKKSKIFIE